MNHPLLGKRIACLITHFFRPAWRAQQILAQLEDLCTSKGRTVAETGHVRWPNLHRKRQISRVITQLRDGF